MAKLLAATAETQGMRKSDFNWVPEGEFVFFTMVYFNTPSLAAKPEMKPYYKVPVCVNGQSIFECDRDRKNIDGGCGCRRCMCGIACHKSTTTFKVVECADEDVAKLHADLEAFYRDCWHMDSEAAKRNAEGQMVEILDVCETFPAGTILEKRGDSIRPRR